ncbi:hypothetical protein A71_201 [Escherichia phage A7_1]|uniref:Lipoprotein n=1 Tax=Escherichia phage A5-4 TaxID=2996162 RepID=A0AAE9PRN9_9CAUD|nr:hypothetical protein A71_201 [Escherichia phage A7_1]UZZ64284.1 hypothetical protein A54_44 [Escherichia phage A5-4]
MKKIIAAIFMVCFISGCDQKGVVDKTTNYILPQEMKEAGCKIYRLKANPGDMSLNVVYCPHADTHIKTSNGKTNKSTSVINGDVDYGY